MRQVLMIAYYFPPFGGAGVQRTLKFVKYLPEFGWRPIILTVNPRRNDLVDPSLLQEIPSEAKVIRTREIRIPIWLPWRVSNLVARWLLLVDGQAGWIPYALPDALRLTNQGEIHALYTTSSPYTDHLIGYRLKRHRTDNIRSNLPWVADFRDPWADNSTLHYPTKVHRKLTEILESKVFHAADRIVLNTEMSTQFYRKKYPSIPETRWVTIPNGYDPSDFTDTIPISQHPTVFSIIHVGSIYRKTRSAINFLHALQQLKLSGLFSENSFILDFVGQVDIETREYVHRNRLEDIVHFSGYIPHQQCVTRMRSADLLLLIPSQFSGSELFLPAKIYEYLAAGKPILCLSTSEPVIRILKDAGIGWIIDPNEIEGIVQNLIHIFHQWKDGKLIVAPNPEVLACYNRRSLTADLVKVLEQISSSG